MPAAWEVPRATFKSVPPGTRALSYVAKKIAVVVGMMVKNTTARMNKPQICCFDFWYMKLAKLPPNSRNPIKTLAIVTIKAVLSIRSLSSVVICHTSLRRRGRCAWLILPPLLHPDATTRPLPPTSPGLGRVAQQHAGQRVDAPMRLADTI